MAITIPSRHIYDTPQNNKVKDNIIDRINISAKTSSVVTDIDEIVYETEQQATNQTLFANSDEEEKIYSANCVHNSSGTYLNYILFSHIHLKIFNQKFCDFTLTFSKASSGKYVQDLSSDVLKDIIFIGTKTKKTSSPDVKYLYEYRPQGGQYYDGEENKFTFQEYTTATETTSTETIEYKVEESISAYEKIHQAFVGYGGEDVHANAYLQRKDIPNPQFTVTDNGDSYTINIRIVCSYSTWKIIGNYWGGYREGAYRTSTGNVGDQYAIQDNGFLQFPVEKIIEEYNCTSVIFKIHGEVLKLNISDSIVIVPDPYYGDKAFAVSGNELLQTNNKWASTTYPAIAKFYSGTYLNYKNGKETAVILCDIANYYENNVLKISPVLNDVELNIEIAVTYGTAGTPAANDITFSIEESQNFDVLIKYYYTPYLGTMAYAEAIIKKGELEVIVTPGGSLPEVNSKKAYYKYNMIFHQYDEVIPMIFGADGKDYPLSKDEEGNAKVFVVLSSKVYYDGAVWQELTLQEK